MLTSLNKCIISFFKLLSLMQILPKSSKDKKYCLNHLKIKTKLPHMCNIWIEYTCSLVCDVIDFICNLKLFRAISRNCFDDADSFLTISWSINYVCSKEWFLITNKICEILKQTNPYHRSFSLISIGIKIF